MAVFKSGGVWWYKFYFAGQFIPQSSKSTSKTVAKDAERDTCVIAAMREQIGISLQDLPSRSMMQSVRPAIFSTHTASPPPPRRIPAGPGVSGREDSRANNVGPWPASLAAL